MAAKEVLGICETHKVALEYSGTPLLRPLLGKENLAL